MRFKNKKIAGLLIAPVVLLLFSSDVRALEGLPGSPVGGTTLGSQSNRGGSREYYVHNLEKNPSIAGEGQEIPPPEGYLSVDTPPIVSNVLSTIIYSKATEGTSKQANISYVDMEGYAKANSPSQHYYSYKDAAAFTEERTDTAGYKLSERLKNLHNEGLLISERERTGLMGFWDKATNTFSKYTKSKGGIWLLNSSTAITFITEPIATLAKEGTDGILKFTDSLTPASLFYNVSNIEYGDSDFGKLTKIFVEETIGNDVSVFKNIFVVIVGIAVSFIGFIAIVEIYVKFSRGKMSESFKAFRKYGVMILVPVIFTATLPSYIAFRQGLVANVAEEEVSAKLSSDENLVVDVKKWAFVSNFDMSKLGDGKDITSEELIALNQALDDRLGSVEGLAAVFDSKDQSPMDKLLGGETFTATQYISFIEKASKKTNREGSNIQSNALPEGIEWGDNSRSTNTFWVSRYNPLHPYVGDLVGVTGIAKFVDNELGKTDSVASEETDLDKERFLYINRLSDMDRTEITDNQIIRGEHLVKNEISYNPKNYSFTDVRRSNAWTYIYGGRPSGSFMSSLIDNYTFGSSLTLADDLTEKSGRGIKAEGSDNLANKDGTIDNKETDYYLQLSNALKIAIFNRYAGVGNVSMDGDKSLSNQSTFFLLSSHITEDGLELYLKNTNFNEQDQGKAGSNTEVRYNRYAMPSKSKKEFFAKLGIINSQSLAISILSLGLFIAVLRTNLGSVLLPIWVYFKNIYLKQSVLAMGMFYLSDITLLILSNHAKIILTTFYKLFSSVTQRINSEGLFQSTSAFALTLVLATIAGIMVYPFFKVKGGKKQSMVELLLNMALILRDTAIEPLQKLENILYGKTIDQGQTQGEDLSMPRTRGFGSMLKNYALFRTGKSLVDGAFNKGSKGKQGKDPLAGREDMDATSTTEAATEDSVLQGEGGGQAEHIFEPRDIFAQNKPEDIEVSGGASALLKNNPLSRSLVNSKFGQVLSRSAQSVGSGVVTAANFAKADNQTKLSMMKSGAYGIGRALASPVTNARSKFEGVKQRMSAAMQDRATKIAEKDVFQQSDYNKVQYLAKQFDVENLRKLDVNKLDLSVQEKGELNKLKKAFEKEGDRNLVIEKAVMKEIKAKYGLSALGGNTIQGQEAYEKYKKEIQARISERQLEARENYQSTEIIRELAKNYDDQVSKAREEALEKLKTEHSFWDENQGSETLTNAINFIKNRKS